MKRITCPAAALALAGLSGPVAAGMNDLIIEYYQGELERKENLFADAASKDGQARGLSITFPTTDTAYLRADFVRETQEAVYGPGSYQLDGGQPVDIPGYQLERQRQVRSLVIGAVDMANSELRIFADIGVAKIRREETVLDVTTDENNNLLAFDVTQVTREKSSPMVRLGFTGEDGRFAWHLTGEYVHDALQRDFTEQSEKWWHFYIGYQLTPNIELGVRYSDTEEFKTPSGSLRVRF